MFHAIGRKARGDGDLVGMLTDCHLRIRNFNGLAVAVSEETAPPAEVVDVCARVERYFSEALPLHVRDEEESILPRLRGRSPAIDAALEQMHEQHELHVELVDRLIVQTAALRVAPDDPTARAALRSVARSLRSVFELHLQAEEAVIFPAVRTLVSVDEQAVIVRELGARRSQAATPASSR